MSDLPDDWNKRVKDCHEYLATGGLGEVTGLTLMYAQSGPEKIQNDIDLEFAILELAQEGLNARKRRPTDTDPSLDKEDI